MRTALSFTAKQLSNRTYANEVEGTPPAPSWNVAPTQGVAIIAERLEDGAIDRHLLVARWGLVPSWAKDLFGDLLGRRTTVSWSPVLLIEGVTCT